MATVGIKWLREFNRFTGIVFLEYETSERSVGMADV